MFDALSRTGSTSAGVSLGGALYTSRAVSASETETSVSRCLSRVLNRMAVEAVQCGAARKAEW